MEKIKSLHFPETIAQHPGFRQLLLFFDTITQLLPAEDSLQDTHPFVKAGLIRQYAPLPFADDLGKFNRLVQDIQRHSPDFYGSSISSLSSQNAIQVDESSVMALISQMRPKDESKTDPRQTEALLQARLLLKLAEIKSFREEELRENIQSVIIKKARLLAALKGDEEELAEGLAEDLNMEIEAEPPLRFKQRLRAWTSLFLADKEEKPWLITTGPNDALDLLSDTIANKNRPELLFTISLSDPIEAGEKDSDASSFILDFQKRTKSCREAIFANLKKAAETGFLPKTENISGVLDTWEGHIRSLPKGKGRNMDFYLVGMSFPELLVEGLGMKTTEVPAASAKNTILGVLR